VTILDAGFGIRDIQNPTSNIQHPYSVFQHDIVRFFSLYWLIVTLDLLP